MNGDFGRKVQFFLLPNNVPLNVLPSQFRNGVWVQWTGALLDGEKTFDDVVLCITI